MTGWHPVALGNAIEPAMAAGIVLDGAEVVVWRDAGGRVHAWEDRCPHRGMRLSFGFVRGDRLACLYHGWQYDGDGICRFIPAHPDLEVPASICVPRHAVAEAAGMIWMRVVGDDPAPAGETQPPVRSLYVDADAATLRDACAEALGATAVTAEGPLLRLTTPGGSVFAGVQRVGPQAAALHLSMAADAPARLRVARQALSLRRILERGA